MIEQRSAEWFEARLGKITASKIIDVMAKQTTAAYQNYMTQLICERITGQTTDTFTSAAMQHGIDTEPQARAMYELTTGRDVVGVGFCDHPVLPMVGASPDGLISTDGLLEIKCPQPNEHMRMLLGGDIQPKYVFQMHLQMMCAERAWCDFASFSPVFPGDLQMEIRRVERSADTESEIFKAITDFSRSIATKMHLLEERKAA